MYVAEARICSHNRADTPIATIDRGIETKRGEKKEKKKEKKRVNVVWGVTRKGKEIYTAGRGRSPIQSDMAAALGSVSKLRERRFRWP